MGQRIAIALLVMTLALTVAATSSLGQSRPAVHRDSHSTSVRAVAAKKDGLARLISARPTVWAVVKWNGTLLYRSPGVLGASRVAKGNYVVSFASGVRACAWLATNRALAPGGDEPHAVNVDTETMAAATKVRVLTFNEVSSGGVLRDSAFSLAAIC
jgi:hypothetical protein